MKCRALLAVMAVCGAASGGDVRTAYVFSASHLDITFTGMPPLSYARCHRIFDAALDLAEQQDTFRFVIENQYLLSEYLRTHPEKVSRLAAAIRKGRIELAGQWTSMLQNVATGEDLARNILYAVGFARGKLNAAPRMQSLSDTPGQTGQLPQLLTDAGMAGVLITRAGPKDAPMFEWEGLDGSRTRAVYLPGGYAGGYLMGMAESLEAMEGSKLAEFELSDISPEIFPNRIKQPASLLQFLQFAIPKGMDRALIETAWDNAMPPARLAANMAAWNKRHKDELLLVPAFPSEFLKEHWPAKAALKKGDIPSVWFNGGWSLIGGYQLHIRTSHELARAEKWASLAQVLLNKEYPAEDLRRGWQQHLITLDHEGSGLTFQAQDAESIALRVGAESRQALASHVANPGPQDIAVVVFNPLNWKRTGIVTAEVAIVGDPFAFFTRPWHKLRLMDGNQREIPFEIVSSKSTIIRTIQVRFRAQDVPSMGWKAYYLRPADEDRSQRFAAPETVAGSTEAGPIAFDAGAGVIKLGTAAQLRYYHQPETTSATPGFFRQQDSGSPVAVQWKSVRKSRDIRGAVLQLEGAVGDARLTLDILAPEGLPLQVSETLRWRGGQPIKLIRDVQFAGDGQFLYGTPFGTRGMDEVVPGSGPPEAGSSDELPRDLWQKSREYDGWLAWKTKDRNVALAGEGRGARFEGSSVKTVLFYSDGSLLRPDPGQPAVDEFRTQFLVNPDAGRDGASRLGLEAYNPLEAVVSVNKLSGSLPPEFAAVSESAGAILTSLKQAESGAGLVIRAYAVDDGAGFPVPKFGSLSGSNLLEQKREPRKGAMRKFEVRTELVSVEGKRQQGAAK